MAYEHIDELKQDLRILLDSDGWNHILTPALYKQYLSLQQQLEVNTQDTLEQVRYRQGQCAVLRELLNRKAVRKLCLGISLEEPED